MERCRSCKAPVTWALSTSGAAMPLDTEPSPAGNVLVVPCGEFGISRLAVVLSKGALDRATVQGAVLRTSHFATCPDAPQHRKRGR